MKSSLKNSLFFMVALIASWTFEARAENVVFNVKASGAKGDGVNLDTKAINETIDKAAQSGGGTVFFPAGNYLTGSIHLKSNIALYIDQGATIVAAPDENISEYDKPEHKIDNLYEDFGHRHWHNSLIWGENLHDISILGPGTIWGKGLVRSNKGEDDIRPNKSISLYLCRNVIIRDVTLFHAGWFAILATGVDNFTIDNLKIDTNRDGMDIDCCQHVRISNCSVNSPHDDGICLKSSYGLGFARATENVTITNCQVSGYDEGSFLDGTYKETDKAPTGRIKFGTESNGGFKNITISNCVFDYCRGLALEAVDGAHLENVAIDNITMRDVVNSPIYICLGARMRGPEGTPPGKVRRIMISNIVAYHVDSVSSAIITGIAGNEIEDVKLKDIKIYYKGGGTKEQASRDVPALEKEYPEPERYGVMPAYGFYVRNVKGIQFENIDLYVLQNDFRPAFYLEKVTGADFNRVTAPVFPGSHAVRLNNSGNIRFFKSLNLTDQLLNDVQNKDL
jgi:polygalacturonase